MGYLLRICTSLLGLKIWGIGELLLLKASRVKTIIGTWLRGPFLTHLSNFFSLFRRLFGTIWRVLRNTFITSWRLVFRALRSVGSGFGILATKSNRLILALGKSTLQGFRATAKMVTDAFHRSPAQPSEVRQSGTGWFASRLNNSAKFVMGLRQTSKNITVMITQRVVNQRQIIGYAALTLIVFGGVISAASLGVFSQLPDEINITGTARIIDADLIKVGTTDVRLYGVDAPEPSQRCKRTARGRTNWRCGRKAVTQLSRLVNGNEVSCIRKGTDNLGRIIAQCHAGKSDIAAYMVRKGLAWVSPGDPANYDIYQTKAKTAGAGIWRAKNDPPWTYREARWTKAKARSPKGCPVKGNISGAGRVYYLPWSNKYDRIRIQPKKGERWFCNEREAIRAGWRMTRYP